MRTVPPPFAHARRGPAEDPVPSEPPGLDLTAFAGLSSLALAAWAPCHDPAEDSLAVGPLVAIDGGAGPRYIALEPPADPDALDVAFLGGLVAGRGNGDGDPPGELDGEGRAHWLSGFEYGLEHRARHGKGGVR